MSELHERERKLDDGNKKSTFWGTLWKVAEKVKEGFFEKTSEYLDSSYRILFFLLKYKLFHKLKGTTILMKMMGVVKMSRIEKMIQLINQRKKLKMYWRD